MNISTQAMRQLDHLRWVLTSPSLLQTGHKAFALAATPEPEEVELVMNRAKKQLSSHLSHTKSHFLGSYFEALWAFYLLNSPRYELLASNYQIHDQGRTLGELDYVVRDRHTDTVRHQEIAVKFYLGHTAAESDLLHNWIGPNAIDRLDIKLSHLGNKQLPLSRTELVKKKLLAEFGIETLQTEALVKGYLFWSSPSADETAPASVNTQHLRGTWFYYADFKQILEQSLLSDCTWFELEKHDWIATDAALLTRMQPQLKRTDMLEYLDLARTRERARQFCQIKKKKHGELFVRRLFLVPSSWPAPHSPPTL